MISITTAISHAFNNIKVLSSAQTKEGERIAAITMDALGGNAGNTKVKGWTANLQFKTAKALNAPIYDALLIKSVWLTIVWCNMKYKCYCFLRKLGFSAAFAYNIIYK